MKEANYEEFLHLMLNCYDAFKKVMQTGNKMEKAFAIKGLRALEQMIKERIYEFSEEKKIDPKELEVYFTNTKDEFGKICKETQEKLSELKGEIDPLLETMRAEKKASKRRRNIEKKLRAKG